MSRLFFQLHRVLDKMYENYYASAASAEDADLILNLTLRQKQALGVVSHLTLDKPEGIPLKDLAEMLGMALSAASVFVEGMVRKGLFVRKQNPHDRRAVLITLSDRGRKNFVRLCTYMEEETDKLRESLSRDDWDAFERTAESLYRLLVPEAFMLEKRGHDA